MQTCGNQPADGRRATKADSTRPVTLGWEIGCKPKLGQRAPAAVQLKPGFMNVFIEIVSNAASGYQVFSYARG